MWGLFIFLYQRKMFTRKSVVVSLRNYCKAQSKIQGSQIGNCFVRWSQETKHLILKSGSLGEKVRAKCFKISQILNRMLLVWKLFLHSCLHLRKQGTSQASADFFYEPFTTGICFRFCWCALDFLCKFVHALSPSCKKLVSGAYFPASVCHCFKYKANSLL